jgi:hypothetical protein
LRWQAEKEISSRQQWEKSVKKIITKNPAPDINTKISGEILSNPRTIPAQKNPDEKSGRKNY